MCSTNIFLFFFSIVVCIWDKMSDIFCSQNLCLKSISYDTTTPERFSSRHFQGFYIRKGGPIGIKRTRC
ncbi:Protein of unknown function [Cotesia congregata]|uniref:Secreted protein n=1 Tax=Cotesia congregata TaxID=51543 RepID=A0A8J2MFX0_COTCN|nr:Protein of unknown function [Cotesia congregata]